MPDLEQLTSAVAREFDVAQEQIVPSCTGVIGVPLPISTIVRKIPGLSRHLQSDSLDRASEAILTTDRRPKTASVRIGDLVLTGFAKGAAMLEPNMATMLCYFLTNVALPGDKLQQILRRCVDRTFNAISVDSDTSTSDTVALLSTATAKETSSDQEDFERALLAVCAKIARDIVGQAEGGSKVLEAVVSVPTSSEDAKQLAKSLINSPLLKAAVHGADPNWGRVVMALGKPQYRIGITELSPTDISISVNSVLVFESGQALPFNRDKLSAEMLAKKTVLIDVKIGDSTHTFRAWGCDLSEEYVTINAEYTT